MAQQAPCMTPGDAIHPVVGTVSVSPCSGAWSVSATDVCVSGFVLGEGEAKGSFALEVTLWGPPFLGLTISSHFL